MEKQKLIPEQEVLVNQLLPTEEEQEIIFDDIYADSAFEDKSDQIMRLGAFKKGMKALRKLDLIDKPEITESAIILKLSQKITDLEQDLKMEENRTMRLLEQLNIDTHRRIKGIIKTLDNSLEKMSEDAVIQVSITKKKELNYLQSLSKANLISYLIVFLLFVAAVIYLKYN